MKRWIGLALILVPILAPAAAFWDGTAALQRGDASFEAGMFGASNSFAPDTLVLVQNLETGQTATVTITGRVAGQSDMLVVLSPTAAAALGIKAGAVATVRLTLAPRAAASASSVAEQTTTQDPDLNPAVAYGGPTGAAAPAETAPAETAPATTEAAPPTETTAQAAVTQAPQTAPPTETTPTAAAQPAAEAPNAAEDAAILAAAASRIPQKKVFLPPREDKTFAYVPPVPTQPVQTATTAATTTTTTTGTQAAPPAEPQITAVIGEPGVTPPQAPQENLALAEAAAPQESVPQEIVGAEASQPAQAPAAAAVALAEPEPIGEEKPPAAPVQTEVTEAPAAPPVSPPAVVALLSPEPPAPASESPAVAAAAQAATQQSSTAAATVTATTPAAAQSGQPAAAAASAPRPPGDTWYLQLAAYATEKGAQDLAARLSATYPTQVIAPAATGARMFRVVVGPLNRAESGTLLVWFRFRGFPDAFVRQE